MYIFRNAKITKLMNGLTSAANYAFNGDYNHVRTFIILYTKIPSANIFIN